jgi:hypothetical protein
MKKFLMVMMIAIAGTAHAGVNQHVTVISTVTLDGQLIGEDAATVPDGEGRTFNNSQSIPIRVIKPHKTGKPFTVHQGIAEDGYVLKVTPRITDKEGEGAVLMRTDFRYSKLLDKGSKKVNGMNVDFPVFDTVNIPKTRLYDSGKPVQLKIMTASGKRLSLTLTVTPVP